jgi:glycolate oxidase iron-sulfur subunit
MRRLPLWHGSALAEPTAIDGPVVGLLTGCVMGPWFRPVHRATVAVLSAAGYQVVESKGQTCCGALAAHDGAAEHAAALAERNVAAFAEADLIVSNAAGCTAHLVGYGEWADGGEGVGARTRDVLEVVAEALSTGALPIRPFGGGRVAVQDPCHHRHALRMIDPVRTIVSAAGFEPLEIDRDGMCCGAAGVYSLLRPKTSAQLGRIKADQVIATGAEIAVSANPGCEMQLRTHLGDSVRVMHPVELYAEAVGLL